MKAEFNETDSKDSSGCFENALTNIPGQCGQPPDDTLEVMKQILLQLSALASTTQQDMSSLTPDLNIVAQRLAELVQGMLRCVRVGVVLLEPGSGKLHPLALAGPADTQQWWLDPAKPFLKDYFDPALVVRMYAGEVILVNLTSPVLGKPSLDGGMCATLIVPMRLGKQLLGILCLEYDQAGQAYIPQETELARAIAPLAILILERVQIQANERALYAANERMDEFLGIVSHELRTPLATIKAYIGLIERLLNKRKLVTAISLEEHVQTCEKLIDILQSADQQVNRLNLLIQDLLDATRIQMKELELHLQPCNLVTIVQETVMEQRSVAGTRPIHLYMPADINVPIIADRNRIGQVITNYLANALKYSSEESPVEVELQVEEQITRVLVHDHGPGIPPEEQQHIWERFYRTKEIESHPRTGIGLGLGLYICRMILMGHRGEYGVESRTGQGSTFWFTLPLAL